MNCVKEITDGNVASALLWVKLSYRMHETTGSFLLPCSGCIQILESHGN